MIKWSFPLTGLRKKLDALSKQKDRGIFGRWSKGLINHLYWSVASTPGRDQTLMKTKWFSVDNHIHNVHQGRSNNFLKCLHGDLLGHEAKNGFRDVSKSRSNNPSSVHNLLMYCLSLQIQKQAKGHQPLLQVHIYLFKDVTRLSASHQTSCLESFHGVVIHFAQIPCPSLT